MALVVLVAPAVALVVAIGRRRYRQAVDHARALAVLGIDADFDPPSLRAAYRAALRRTHPDVAGVGSASGVATAEVVAAYRLLRDGPPPRTRPAPAPARTPPAPSPAPVVGVVVDGDTVAADLPAGDLFAMLVEVADSIGEIAYVDRSTALLEIVTEFAGYGACSVVLSLQGRATGVTEAFCTVEALGGGPVPPAHAVADLLAHGLRALLAKRP